jgi:hypothetical protein
MMRCGAAGVRASARIAYRHAASNAFTSGPTCNGDLIEGLAERTVFNNEGRVDP